MLSSRLYGRLIYNESSLYLAVLMLPLFINFKDAYDGVNRQEIWKVMEEIGTPRKLVGAGIYSNDGKSLRSCGFEARTAKSHVL